MENKWRGFFWFSEKQKQYVKKFYRNNLELCRDTFCRLDSDGIVYEYTEWTDSEINTSKWDDMKFLGKGAYEGK
jgi:hypothetical protein